MEQYRPLKGVKIVELSQMVAISSCCRMMADWGADVIKVENTKGGDNYRRWPAGIGAPIEDKFNPIFDNLNANKRGLSIDTSTPEGMEVMMKLLSEADAFVTNVRVGALKKSGLDYASLKDKFPKLVMAQLHGYGEKGPESHRPGYDNTAFWARGGFMYSQSIYDSENAYPVYMPMGVGDVSCAIEIMAGTMAAIYAARKTGKGDYISSSLYGTATWLANILVTGSKYNLIMPKSRKAGVTAFGLVCKCKDGKWFLPQVTDFIKDSQKFFKIMGFEDMVGNPKYDNRAAFNDEEVMQWLCGRVEEAFATKTSEEWAALYTADDLCFEILRSYDDALEDEQAWANDYLYRMKYENGKEVVLVRTAMRSERMGLPPFERAPMLGEHTKEVLAELGYDDAKIDGMLTSGAAKQHD